MKSFNTLVAGIFLWLLPAGASGQILPFHFYTTKDGLLSNRITGVSQDPSGYLWVATFEGLSVFDGQTFRNFTSSEGLSTSVVWCVEASSASPGTIWLGPDEGGLTRFRDGKFTTMHLSASRDMDVLNSIDEDPDGTIWCVTGGSVNVVRGDSVTSVLVSTPKLGFSNIIHSSDGTHWVARDHTLFEFTREGRQSDSVVFDIAPDVVVSSLFADADTTLWACTSDGTIFHLRHRTIVGTRHLLDGDGISSCLVDRQGNLWLGRTRGISKVARNTFETDPIQNLGPSNGLPVDLMLPLLVDHEGDIWGSTWNHGLFKLADQKLLFFPAPPGETVHSLVMDSTDHGWLLLDRSIMQVWNDASGWHSAAHSLPYVDPKLGAQYMIRSGDTIAVSYLSRQVSLHRIVRHASGASELRFAGWCKTLLTLPGLGNFPIAADSLGRVWYSLESEYVALLDFRTSSVVKMLKHPDDMPFSGIRAITVDRERNLWFGGFENGLAVLPHGDWAHEKLRVFTKNDGLPDDKIRSLFADDSMNLWIGTRHGGLSVYRNGRFRTLTEREGLLSNTIWSIVQTKDRDIWLGTSLGVMSLNPERPEELSTLDETRGYECVRCEVDRHDRIWVMAIEGIFICDDRTRHWTAPPPPVFVSRVSVNGNEVGVHTRGEFSHDQNNVAIEYIGISLRDEGSVRYQYMLEGVDQTWSNVTAQRQVTYAALNPGTYTFRVEAFNGQRMKSASPASYTFTIAPPYWRRWWFIMTANGVVLGAIALTAIRRVRTFRRERRMQQEFSRRLLSSQEEERKRIAAELHDSIGQDLTLIKNHSVLGLNNLPTGSPAAAHLQEIDAISSQTMQDVRRISHNLRPYQIDRLGITRAIRALVDGFAESSGIRCAADLDPIDGLLGSNGEISVYRIMQEVFSNIGRHSRATSVEVRVRKEEGGTISIEIADDGRGMPASEGAARGEHAGLGLESIAERVQLLGGAHTISSGPGSGTRFIIRVPYGQT